RPSRRPRAGLANALGLFWRVAGCGSLCARPATVWCASGPLVGRLPICSLLARLLQSPAVARHFIASVFRVGGLLVVAGNPSDRGRQSETRMAAQARFPCPPGSVPDLRPAGWTQPAHLYGRARCAHFLRALLALSFSVSSPGVSRLLARYRPFLGSPRAGGCASGPVSIYQPWRRSSHR